MQKKLIALAIAGLSSTAFAQSNVEIYGVLDVGYQQLSGTYSNNGVLAVGAANQKNVSQIAGSNSSTNRLGFRGKENLGNGLGAQFNIETTLNSDGGAAAGAAGTTGLEAASRIMTVGLNGSWGTVNFGRQYTPFFSTVAAVDPFGSTGIASAGVIHPSGVEGITRMSSSIRYDHKFGPVSVAFMYGLGEDMTTAAGGNTNIWSASALWGYGPGALGIAHINIEDPSNVNAALAADDDRVYSTVIGGLHSFGAFSLHYAYNMLKSSGTTLAAAQVNHGDWHLGLTVPMGAHTFKATYNVGNDKSTRNQDATSVGLGYQYDLSKRTAFYGQYAKVSNKNGASYALTRTAGTTAAATGQGAGNLGANVIAAGAGAYTTGFNVGIKHSF